MIPSANRPEETYVVVNHPTKTYSLEVENDRIRKMTDGLKAMEQFIFKLVNTERYKYPIYNWNYGIELNDLIGKQILFCKAEIPRRIEEALSVDDRVISVRNFEYLDTNDKNILHVTFTVETIYGDITSSRQVNI